jgi:thiol reductant ABC exporter CydC subunit
MIARWLRHNLGPLPKRPLAEAAAWGVLSTGAGLGLMATSGWLIARASQRPPIFELSIAIGAVQAFALGRGLTRYCSRLAVHGVSLATLARLRVWLYDRVEPLVPNGLPQRGTGAVLTGFVADTERVTRALAGQVAATVDLTASIVLGAAIAAVLAPGAGVVLLGGALVMVAVALCTARMGRGGARDAAATRARLADSVVDIVRSAPELLMYGREDLVEQELDRAHQKARSAALRQAMATGFGRGSAALLAGAGVVAVVCTGLGAHRTGTLSGVDLTAITLVALAVFDQLLGLPTTLAAMGSGDAAARRLGDLARLEPAVREPVVDHSPPTGAHDAALAGVRVMPPRADPDARPILDDVSIRVQPGERVALVGASGSGKTSALQTLLHLLEASSGVTSIGGVDVREMTRVGIAQHLSWLDAETHVFTATLADNLRLGSPHASDRDCEKVLDRVGLSDWYRSLPHGLGTVVGAGGRPVSAGERQRLGMARALISGACVVLLDEPTSHIDSASSATILAELVGAAGSRSVLVVSHDQDIAAHVDRVVSLDAGRVIAATP